jgi:hypothetical protein
MHIEIEWDIMHDDDWLTVRVVADEFDPGEPEYRSGHPDNWTPEMPASATWHVELDGARRDDLVVPPEDHEAVIDALTREAYLIEGASQAETRYEAMMEYERGEW